MRFWAFLVSKIEDLSRNADACLEAVDWRMITKDKPEAWLYFYEDFLEAYDNKLRKRTALHRVFRIKEIGRSRKAAYFLTFFCR
jgi:hypothetical protein